MGDTRQRVILGTAQPVVRCEWPTGRPTSAVAVAVYDPDYSWDESPNPLASGSATLSSASTTLSSAVAAGATSLPLTNRTGFAVDEWYWLENAGGQRERVEVVAIVAGSGNAGTATTRFPVAFAHGSGATVKSARMSFTMPAGLDSRWADDEYLKSGYPVTWTYGGDRITTLFDLVRAEYGVLFNVEDFYELAPDAAYMQPQSERGLHFRRQIAAAQQQVEIDLSLAGYPVDRIRGTDGAYKLLVTLKLGMLLARLNVKPASRPAAEVAAEFQAEYRDLLARVLSSRMPPGSTLDTDEDGAGDVEDYDNSLLRGRIPGAGRRAIGVVARWGWERW